MNLIADWIEEKIQAAIAKGEFENLPGAGQPIDLDDDTYVPNDQKMAFRVLKNSGFVPPELLVLQEVKELRRKLSEDKDLSYDQHLQLKRRLVLKEAEFNMAIERMQKTKK